MLTRVKRKLRLHRLRFLSKRRRPAAEPAPNGQEAAPRDADWINVADLVKTVSIEELAERAEGYFRAVENPDLILAKPLQGVADAPDLLITFGQVLHGMRPVAGMKVLDFGAGTCWTSRYLAQLGCKVIAVDVSPTALELGRRLFREMPLIGDKPAPEFLVFDGHRFDLPDASVDRILSFDAFHHVPNPADVIREMARVLRPGGLAAFSEPGPFHSVAPMSQYEMRNYGVLENDLIIEDVWKWAQEAGFTELKLCLLDPAPAWVDMETYYAIEAGHQAEVIMGPTRASISNRRMFWLRREGTEVPDSREAAGLVGDLTMKDIEVERGDGLTVITATCRVRNPGPRHWLPSDAEFGPVRIGVRLHLGDLTIRDLTRVHIPGQGLGPGERAEFPVRVEVPAQPEGVVAVEFDLVSELVAWFSVNGSSVVNVPV